jgi:hypothetical protein
MVQCCALDCAVRRCHAFILPTASFSNAKLTRLADALVSSLSSSHSRLASNQQLLIRRRQANFGKGNRPTFILRFCEHYWSERESGEVGLLSATSTTPPRQGSLVSRLPVFYFKEQSLHISVLVHDGRPSHRMTSFLPCSSSCREKHQRHC